MTYSPHRGYTPTPDPKPNRLTDWTRKMIIDEEGPLRDGEGRDMLVTLERDLMQRVLERCGGNVQRAAKVMGITRAGFYAAAKRLGITL